MFLNYFALLNQQEESSQRSSASNKSFLSTELKKIILYNLISDVACLKGNIIAEFKELINLDPFC